MAKKKLSTDKAVTELQGKFKEHQGSNGISSDGTPVHLPVDTDNDGFATKKMFKEHQQLFEHRERIPSGTDILKLTPGRYEGSGLINHPLQPDSTKKTTWISNVNVEDGNDGRREITVFDNLAALLWKRSIHTGGDPASGSGGWVQYHGVITLWSGNSKLTKAVTLNNNVHNTNGSAKYSNILVQYITDTRQTGLALGTVNGVLINKINLNDNSEKMAPDLYEAELTFPTSTTAKLSRNKRINFYTHENDKTAYIQAMAGAINIQRIMGVM